MYSGESLGSIAIAGKKSIVLKTHSEAVLGGVACKTALVDHLWENIPYLLDMWCPGAPVLRLVMDQSSFSWGSHSSAVGIKISIDFYIGGYTGFDS